MNFFVFIDNAALMLVMSLLSTNIQLRWFKRENGRNIILGVLYGLSAVMAMQIPMVLQPGVIFDSRSVILSLGGLFTGGITTLIACGIAAIARFLIGGPGTFTGVGSIVISGFAGLLFRRIVRARNLSLNMGWLFLFGFLVHLILVAWFFTFPIEIALSIIENVALPYLVVFPLATMLIGAFLIAQQQRLNTEANLVKSEKRYRDLVNTLNEGVWEADANKITTFVNPKMAEILGYQPREMIGKSIYDFIAKEDYPAMDRHHQSRRMGVAEQYEFRLKRKDGSLVPVQLGVRPLQDEKGQFLGSLAGVQDISLQKKAQAELAEQSRHLEELVEERTRDLKEAQAQLIKAEKMAALGEVAGSVGHELRNPLAVISNSVYLLKTALTKSDATVREYLQMIETETHNASQIINDLLDYSRIQPTVKELVDLSDLISNLLAKYPVPGSVKVENAISGDLPAVKANPQQVEQIFRNLISNAVEAMPDGGKLGLKSVIRKNQLSIAVSDTGVGIPQKNIRKIFEPLFTTKARGIGLGLAITRKLADLNNIGIRVKSKVGQGTTFTLDFMLPL
ncbi:MAG: PAS domain S-box protein [Anaerolineae bacterium]|nr:PAS domain S-box protein [Anaerolineae bacterium]